MAFTCDSATLERLEWPRVLACLAKCATTPRGAERCRAELFEQTRSGVLDRLAETDEVRQLIDAGTTLPLGDVADLRSVVKAAAAGRMLEPRSLLNVARTLAAARAVHRVLKAASERTPRLFDLAQTLPDLETLRRAIESAVTPDAEVRDDATPALRQARRRVRELTGEIDRKMAAFLRSADIRPHLQDEYVTTRERRSVLPVRADAQGRVRGIVHDVSSSGTTVFIEPEAVVELGNRLRLAELEIEREIERVLRELSDRVAQGVLELEAAGETLEVIDLAWARGRLSARLAASPAELIDGGPRFLGLRHPLLELEAGIENGGIANDLIFPPGARGLVISGPNAGGKTVIAKAIGLAALSIRAGLHVKADPGSGMPLFDVVRADIGDEQDLRSGLSTFSARMSNLARIVDTCGPATLVIADEVGEGTEPGEGAALAQAILEALVDRGATVIATTHFNRLKELAGHDERFANASAEFDPATLRPTYRVRLGAPGSSGASFVAARMGMDETVLERARTLMDGDDRRLESLTRSLSELRQELEAERQIARQTQQQTEAARAAYEARLERLRGAREEVLASMKRDLEVSYREARAELARVMRSVQEGQQPAGLAANRAHEQLVSIRARVESIERRHTRAPRARIRAIDWSAVAPGDRLEIEGLSGEARLIEGPDRRGRIVVQMGAIRTELDRTRVRRTLGPPSRRETAALVARSHVEVERGPEPEGLSPECDLRGLRVDEALDRADLHLNRVLGTGASSVTFIHGHGSGALRTAVRSWLRALPYVCDLSKGPPDAGGNGVTIARLER